MVEVRVMTRLSESASLSRTDTSTTVSSDASDAEAREIAALAVVLEADRPDAGSFVVSLEGVSRVVIARGALRRAQRRGAELTLELPDRRVSKPHAALERAAGGFVLSDLGSSNGTFADDFGAGGRVTTPEIVGDRLLRVGHCALAVLGDAAPILERARARRPWPFATLSAALAREFARLERVAPSLLPLLLLGETGTGKEVLARAVHKRAGRPGPFVAVNCGALPANLVEAHLFGHQSGAFSGAVRDEIGFVRAADHGTLFLDEIGDLALGAQASLLRVLQEGEVTPVGAFHPIKVDVRVLSATHHPLPELVAAGRFRADLFARLSGFSFHVPPLRARRLDVGELLASFWPAGHAVTSLHPAAARALLAHDYPMNVRELKQAIDAALILADGAVRLPDLPAAMRERGDASRSPPPTDDAEAALRDELAARLQASGHNLSQVAREMGKARQQVQRWVRRFGLKGG
jgi:sigma-54 interacting transcriptional regulator/FHA domain-containing protein